MSEKALTLSCNHQSLLAIAHLPAPAADIGVGVVIVVGGAQYRVGSHRMFVTMARALCEAGCSVLRFDRRGMGDSSGEDPGFDDCDEDIQAAVAQLRSENPELKSVYLIGLCDGATAAGLCYFSGAEVDGYVFINPWIRSPQTHARVLVSRYYKTRLAEPEFWRELLSGKVHLIQSLKEYVQHWWNKRSRRLVLPSLQSELFYRLQRSGRRALLVLSNKDITGQEFLEVSELEPWRGWLQSGKGELLVFDTADHTFADADNMQRLIETCQQWLQGKPAE